MTFSGLSRRTGLARRTGSSSHDHRLQPRCHPRTHRPALRCARWTQSRRRRADGRMQDLSRCEHHRGLRTPDSASLARTACRNSPTNFPQLAELTDAEFHMIGHLQSNKTAKAAEIFHAVDSIDSAKLAQRLNDAAQKLGKTLDVLIEINVGGEEAKSGIAPDSPETRIHPDASSAVAAPAHSRPDDRSALHRRSRRRASLLSQAARIARSPCRAQSAVG